MGDDEKHENEIDFDGESENERDEEHEYDHEDEYDGGPRRPRSQKGSMVPFGLRATHA